MLITISIFITIFLSYAIFNCLLNLIILLKIKFVGPLLDTQNIIKYHKVTLKSAVFRVSIISIFEVITFVPIIFFLLIVENLYFLLLIPILAIISIFPVLFLDIKKVEHILISLESNDSVGSVKLTARTNKKYIDNLIKIANF